MTMDDLGWGLMMMVVGMGVVFGLLALLMLGLMALGAADRPKPAVQAAPEPAELAAAPETEEVDGEPAAVSSAPTVRMITDGLDENDVAAITVAVMGCVVNGPGEAKGADIGLAGGRGKAVLFASGEKIRTVDEADAVDELFAEIERRFA